MPCRTATRRLLTDELGSLRLCLPLASQQSQLVGVLRRSRSRVVAKTPVESIEDATISNYTPLGNSALRLHRNMEPSNSSHNPRDLLLYSTSTVSRSRSASIGHSRDTEELPHPRKPSSRVNLSKSRPRRWPSQPADCYSTPRPALPRHNASGTDNKLSSRILRLLLDSSGLRSMSALRSPRFVVGRRRSFWKVFQNLTLL